ncbi:hypothetical protein [Methylobacterium currus]|uniref:hypothetical protein n=1 Tax=Methylobacterium currus TaxID=2051553 RepID=UPI0039C1B147
MASTVTINPVRGGDGNDTLIDTAGPDRMSGGAGNDTFKFTAGNLIHELGKTTGATVVLIILLISTALETLAPLPKTT